MLGKLGEVKFSLGSFEVSCLYFLPLCNGGVVLVELHVSMEFEFGLPLFHAFCWLFMHEKCHACLISLIHAS